MQKQLNKSYFKNSIISLNLNEFKDKIKKVNAENKDVTENQMSNMSNIHKSLLIAKNQCKDLVYFVEDDYLHKQEAIIEMIFAYERIASQINRELILSDSEERRSEVFTNFSESLIDSSLVCENPYSTLYKEIRIMDNKIK